jgi:AbrB family looped-hinge helix DNA binding protein
MATTKVSTKGQVILPKAVREARRWGPGTELEIEERGDDVVLRLKRPMKKHRLEDVIGILKHEGPPITEEQIREAAAAGAVARFMRSQR